MKKSSSHETANRRHASSRCHRRSCAHRAKAQANGKCRPTSTTRFPLNCSKDLWANANDSAATRHRSTHLVGLERSTPRWKRPRCYSGCENAHRLASTAYSFDCKSRSSAVTNVNCITHAVAARKRSAGSSYANVSCRLIIAISCVSDASCLGNA